HAAVAALKAQPDLKRTRAFDAAVAHVSRSRGAGRLRGLRSTPARMWAFLRRLLTGRDIPPSWRFMIIGLSAILLAVCAVVVILIVRSVHS
ncbi:MAG: hypothetical protein ACRDNS_12480, partial [Trebonia sp.]